VYIFRVHFSWEKHLSSELCRDKYYSYNSYDLALKKSVKDTKQGKKGKTKVIAMEKCLFFFVER